MSNGPIHTETREVITPHGTIILNVETWTNDGGDTYYHADMEIKNGKFTHGSFSHREIGAFLDEPAE